KAERKPPRWSPLGPSRLRMARSCSIAATPRTRDNPSGFAIRERCSQECEQGKTSTVGSHSPLVFFDGLNFFFVQAVERSNLFREREKNTRGLRHQCVSILLGEQSIAVVIHARHDNQIDPDFVFRLLNGKLFA